MTATLPLPVLTKSPVHLHGHTRRERARSKQPLAYAMRVTGIEAIDPYQVATFKERYTAQFLARVRHYSIGRAANDFCSTFLTCLAIGLTLSVVLKCLAVTVGWIFSVPGLMSLPIFLPIMGAAAPVIGIICAINTVRCERREAQNRHKTAQWLVIPASRNQALPAEAQDMMDELQMRVPGAQFLVHCFDKDPFLEVRLGPESFFIHHWE